MIRVGITAQTFIACSFSTSWPESIQGRKPQLEQSSDSADRSASSGTKSVPMVATAGRIAFRSSGSTRSARILAVKSSSSALFGRWPS